MSKTGFPVVKFDGHPKKRQSTQAINKKEYLFEPRLTTVIRLGPW